MNNSSWAHSLIDQLILQGTKRFCIAPGSRSTPLVLAAARHPHAKVAVHFDERALCFFALGSAMATKKPAAVIATSGTAVGNLYPAVMEAHHSHIPMILLTADRPPELRDFGSNQATDQVKIFSPFVRWQTDLPCPSDAAGETYIRSQAAQAVFHAMQGGPVQINCPFREPLFETPTPQNYGSTQPLFLPSFSPTGEQIAYVQNLLQSAKRGVIAIGRLNCDPKPILELAARLRWPVFADLLSQARRFPTREQVRQFDYAIRSGSAPQPDCILHFGGRFTSKELPEWMKRSKAILVHIDANGERIDPSLASPARIYSDPTLFCQSIPFNKCQNNLKNREFGKEIPGESEHDDSTDRTDSPREYEKGEPDWLAKWQEIDTRIERAIEVVFNGSQSFTQAHWMRELGRKLPSNTAIFLANSMPIRDAEHFLFPKSTLGFFANRGLSGIDGQLATAVGIAEEMKAPMVAILGDQSCLHDLNSLALLRSVKMPFLLIVSNNFGGEIFSYLPVARESEHFETLFAATHDLRFESAAGFFQIPYRSLTHISHALSANLLPESGAQILEIFTSRKENACFQRRILGECFQITSDVASQGVR